MFVFDGTGKNRGALPVISFENSRRNDEEVECIERELKRREKDKVYRSSGLEGRFLSESFDTYTANSPERKSALSRVLAYVASVHSGVFMTLIMLGATGCGKTHLAAGCIRELGGLYRYSDALRLEYSESLRFGSISRPLDVIAKYAKSRFLVIDEVGRTGQAETEQYCLGRILDGRYVQRLPTVLISNLDKAEFAAFLRRAAVDRLNESAITIEFSGESYRPVLRMEEKL